MKRLVAATAVLAAAAAVSGPVSAQDFYAGKQVRIIVSSASGGGYDAYARLLQRHMPKYIPGNPSTIVMNMPGAGGLIAANHVANIAEKDGTVFGTFNRYSAVMPLLGSDQAKFKAEDFQWLGTTASYSDNSYLLVIRAALPHKTIADLRNPDMPIHIGNTGTDVPAILKEALGLNFKLVSGYKGSDEMEIAFERGEVDGHTSGYNSILSRHPEWIEKGFIRPVIQFGRIDRLPALKDVPTARELAQNSVGPGAGRIRRTAAAYGAAVRGTPGGAGRPRRHAARRLHEGHGRSGIHRGRQEAEAGTDAEERRGGPGDRRQPGQGRPRRHPALSQGARRQAAIGQLNASQIADAKRKRPGRRPGLFRLCSGQWCYCDMNQPPFGA